VRERRRRWKMRRKRALFALKIVRDLAALSTIISLKERQNEQNHCNGRSRIP
jgi:hypothetical protein